MQNLNSEQYEDSQEENWTFGNEHGNSGARTDDSVVYESIANVPQNMEIRENVTLRKHSLRPAKSMKNINSRQNEDNPNEKREYEGVYYGNIGRIVDRNYLASGGVNYEDMGWSPSSNHLHRPERSRSDVSYTDLRNDQKGKTYNQRFRDNSSLNHGDGVSRYDLYEDKTKKKCVVM
ncbi:uncharacterized protein LOC132729399 [Ruditapes philippinarum]|uniref:uncharacterized protein LOC132729399 n=1 Tax=Ruditapes philippinarum TaxID=129788 RepID=UPI00295C0927|nr:uncharacterized protein LOC132729399 [Ruditapes philippinarum]